MIKNKIGIITFHNTANYGAALQAYATFKIISELHENTEIVDYSNTFRDGKYSAYHRLYEGWRTLKIVNILISLLAVPAIILRNWNFNRFYKLKLRVSSVKYDGSNFNTIGNSYTKLIAGSDQIWSPKNNGDDYNYLLAAAKSDVKKYSYASSFGLQSVPTSKREFYKKFLSEFTSISVRETSGKEIVQHELQIDNVRTSVDPVFLLDKVDLLRLAEASNLKCPDSFSLVYVNDCKFWHPIEKSCTDNVIYTIGSFLPKHLFSANIRVKNYLGPNEFLKLINGSTNVFTTSYHAVIVSIILQKSFYVFLSGDRGRDLRLINLLERLELTHRIINKGNQDCVDINYNECIDYNFAHDTLAGLVEDSLEYIRSVIDD